MRYWREELADTGSSFFASTSAELFSNAHNTLEN